MNEENMVTGHVVPTTPASTALDTLKALVHRNIDHIEYVLDRLSDSDCGVADDVIDFLDGIKANQYRALAEHLPVAHDERLGELRHFPPAAYKYADGSLVVERFESRYGTTVFYPRYGGDREARLAQHLAWVQQVERRANEETTFDNIVRGVDWGSSGPSDG